MREAPNPFFSMTFLIGGSIGGYCFQISTKYESSCTLRHRVYTESYTDTDTDPVICRKATLRLKPILIPIQSNNENEFISFLSVPMWVPNWEQHSSALELVHALVSVSV